MSLLSSSPLHSNPARHSLIAQQPILSLFCFHLTPLRERRVQSRRNEHISNVRIKRDAMVGVFLSYFGRIAGFVIALPFWKCFLILMIMLMNEF